MQLSELVITRADAVVRRIGFKRGLNLILDKPTANLIDTGNSIGKTTVLRLIDCCLGSKGDDIWQDSEFKSNINQDVYDFLHGDVPVYISLTIEDSIRGKHTLVRSFEGGSRKTDLLQIDQTTYTTLKAYGSALKQLLFGYSGTKPTMRQLAPKFVRSSPALMSKTLKFLGDYGSETDYEVLHLLLFGFNAVAVLEELPQLSEQKKKLERDRQALTRTRTEGQLEQLLLYLRREVEQIEASRELHGEVPEIATRATHVTSIRAKAIEVAGILSRYDSELAALNLAIGELQSEYSNVDHHAIEAIYRDAQRYIPKLQHDWDDLADFVQNLRGRKQRFLESQIASLQENASRAKSELSSLQAQEKEEIGTLVKSAEFAKALELRSDLQEKLKQLGSLEQDLRDLKDLREKITSTEKQLEKTREQIEKEKTALRGRLDVFNQYFSALSKELYGEEYLLYFDETNKGILSFKLRAVGANVGAGKKASQTAAFDLAYIKFLRHVGMNFPTFVCHDGVEQIHGNQLAALLTKANGLDGQLILATLRDKLPHMPEGFLKENTVLELSQADKLFHL